MEANAPWRDEETLRQKYWVEGKSLTVVGDELGCTKDTIAKWLRKNGLGVRDAPGDPNADYRDKELLEKLYWDEGLSTIAIADKLDCSKETVQRWMGRFGIDTRQSFHDKNGCFFTTEDGYEIFALTEDYETTNISIHRLTAIAEGELSPNRIRDKSINIHHKNGIPWDNRPENIEVLTVAEHAKEHYSEREHKDNGDFR